MRVPKGVACGQTSHPTTGHGRHMTSLLQDVPAGRPVSLYLNGRGARLAVAITLGALSTALLAWTVLRAHPHDLLVFLRAGSEVAAGHSPYLSPKNPALWSGSAFVYPWVMAWPFAVLNLLPQALAVVLFRLGGLVAVVMGCRLAGCRRALAALALVGSSVLILGLQQGTLDALLFGGLILAWRSRDRPILLALLLAALVASELFLWPLLVWALCTRRVRAAIGACILSAVVVGIGFIQGEPLSSYIASLSELSRHEGPHSVSLFALALQAGTSTIGASVLSVLVGLVIVGFAIVAERRTSYSIGFAGAVGASLIATPILWSHFLLLLAVPLLIADVSPRTKMILLGLFDVASWIRYTPYGSTWPQATLGVILALVVLGSVAWPQPSWKVLMSRLRCGVVSLSALPCVTLGLICILGFLADARGIRIGVVQGAIIIGCCFHASTALTAPVDSDQCPAPP